MQQVGNLHFHKHQSTAPDPPKARLKPAERSCPNTFSRSGSLLSTGGGVLVRRRREHRNAKIQRFINLRLRLSIIFVSIDHIHHHLIVNMKLVLVEHFINDAEAWGKVMGGHFATFGMSTRPGTSILYDVFSMSYIFDSRFDSSSLSGAPGMSIDKAQKLPVFEGQVSSQRADSSPEIPSLLKSH